MASYTYSIVDDFQGGVKLEQLHGEIVAETSITKTLYGVTQVDNDAVRIDFDESLTSGEETLLDGLVADHVIVLVPIIHVTPSIHPTSTGVNLGSYRLIGTYAYPGNNNGQHEIVAVKIVSHMDVGITSYDVRILDMTNGNILVTKNLTNTTIASNDLGTISNAPQGEAIIEIQMKKNGGASNLYVNVRGITICLGEML